MIANLKPYPTMKDSGVEWLGEVPEHWEVLPNRALFDEIKDRDCPDEQMLSVTIKSGVIRQAFLLEDTSKKDSSNIDKSKYKLVQPGDIAYNKMRAWQGAVGASTYRGIISPAYVVQRPRSGGDTRFFHYLLRTPSFAKEAERWSYGITSDMWSLRPEHFKLIYTCLPPLPEQTAIVRFLDYIDRRVRRYIRAKQKLIRLLEEQKQAIIHRAVTRGLDPDVPLKPSGVEWLGDVPEHWEVRKLKYAVGFSGGGTPSKAKESFWNGNIPWVSPKDMRSERIIDAEDHITEEAVSESATRIVKPDAVLMVVRSGILRRKIPVAINDVDVTLNQDMKALRPRSGLSSEYLLAFIQGKQAALLNEWTKQGATVESVEHEFMANSLMSLPPLPEQSDIVEHLEKAITGIDITIEHTRREISLLREYRARLIADVVTGKLDVREAAAGLPDEAEEPDLLDDVEQTAENVTDDSAEEVADAG